MLILCNQAESKYLKFLKPLLPKEEAHRAVVCASFHSSNFPDTKIITTSASVVSELVGKKVRAIESKGQGATINSYSGSLIRLPSTGQEVLVLSTLEHLLTVPYAKNLFKRYISKFTNPETWWKNTKFDWAIVTDTKVAEFEADWQQADYLALDIETGDNHKIRVLGVTTVKLTPELRTKSWVLPIDSMFNYDISAAVCQSDIPKILQNGMYDASWLLSYNIPIKNYFFDTMGLAHSIYAELPKSLDFLASFWLRESVFWKDEGKNTDFVGQCRYNALDTWATANVFLSMVAQYPEFAKVNYSLKFPEVFPSIACAMEGLRVDMDVRAKLLEKEHEFIESAGQDLRDLLGAPKLNLNSPAQMKVVFSTVSTHAVQGTDVLTLTALAEKDVFAAFFITKFLKYRKSTKLLSTYLNARLYGERFLYSLNPFGAESCRMSAAQSPFFVMEGTVFKHYGQQIQNIPKIPKQMLIADEGFHLFEIDKKASESYCTAALSQDPTLWEVLHTSPDFHSSNISLFMGIPMADVWDYEKQESKDVAFRTLFKRVNHGYNYNMKEFKLVQTMGAANVWKAKARMLQAYKAVGNVAAYHKLYKLITVHQVAAYLLSLVDAVYPKIKSSYFMEVVSAITNTKRIVSPTGYTRICLQDITTSTGLNSYVSHGAQHLSAMLVNAAFVDIWLKLSSPDFMLKAQIHDSIFGQVRIGHEHLIAEAESLMHAKMTIHGKVLDIPNDITYCGTHWK